MADYGLLGGIGAGLQSFTDSYMKSKQMKADNDRNQHIADMASQKEQADLLEKGMENTPTGVQYTPEQAGLVSNKKAHEKIVSDISSQRDIPGSEESNAEYANTVARMKRAGLGHITIPADKPATWYELNVHPHLEKEEGYENARVIAKEKGDLAGLLLKDRLGMQEKRLGETQNQNSIKAGHEYESDPILKLSKTNVNSLKRSQSILDNQNKPVTSKDLNLAYNDYINAVAAGGSATEGKVQRELPQTFETQWNELKQKFGENDDLRKSPQGKQLIDLLKENIRTVNTDIGSAIEEQASNIHENHKQSTNAKVIETSKNKLKHYAPNKYKELYGGGVKEAPSQDSEAVQWARANPKDPRSAAILKANGVQ